MYLLKLILQMLHISVKHKEVVQIIVAEQELVE